MSISASDLEYRLSAPGASAGNQLAQSAAAESLGGWLSTSVWSGGAPGDLFSDVSGDDNAAGAVDYRCLFAVNKHANLTLTDTKLWLPAQVANGTLVAIGVDPTAASALNDDTQQAVLIADVNEPPAGVSFSAPTTKPDGLSLGNIPSGHCRAFWVRRTASNTTALEEDGFDIRFEGESL